MKNTVLVIMDYELEQLRQMMQSSRYGYVRIDLPALENGFLKLHEAHFSAEGTDLKNPFKK